ncbi:tenascin-R [Elysia marginata]|uniref:Tenascin-R n=1 Tax=Elysia marginata TaxID=1093978 RepID=A0AAV4JBA4_9GAST|nr:tenascin-R [Elysia marginata]
MARFLILVFALGFVSYGASSLSLTFETKPTSFPGERWPCGVVTCRENYVTTGPDLDQGHVTTNSSSSTITSMTVFTTWPASAGADNNARRHLLASLTLQQPNITRVSNGMKIDGYLETSRASLRLELFKTRDCSAEFTCEVSSRDAHGTEVVNSNRLQQQQRTQSADRFTGGIGSPAGQSQLMMLVQQLALLENRLEDRMRSIEDKIETRVADKLCQLEAKLTPQSNAAYISQEEENREHGRILIEHRETLKKALDISKQVERNLNETFLVAERHLKQLQTVNKTDVLSPNGPSHCKLLLDGFKQLEQNTCNVSTGILSSVHDQVSLTNTLINSTLQPMSDLLMPKRCERSLVSFVVQTPFPYPIIRPNSESGLSVSYLCDETTDGGGWIVIQRRTSGQEEFYRDWATYKRGFGSLAGDFWIGNDNLHILTSSGDYELRVELKYNGKSAFAHYDKFSVASERNNYALTLGKYAGTAGDALARHKGMPFSTFDKENDRHSDINCARRYIGAWWYKDCHDANLNGKWGANKYLGPRWKTFTGAEPASFTEMKIRSLD